VDAIIKVIDIESDIQKLAVDGENLIRYYGENPDKKQSRIEELYRMKDVVVANDIPLKYKDSMLAEVDRYIDRLNPKNSDIRKFNSNHEFLLYALAGAMLVHIIKDGGKDLEEGIAKGIKEGFYKTKDPGISE